jgi:hypothetical protein
MTKWRKIVKYVMEVVCFGVVCFQHSKIAPCAKINGELCVLTSMKISTT